MGNNYYYGPGAYGTGLSGAGYYKIQLLAGGNVLAEDDSSVAIFNDTFELSTITFDSTGSPYVGQALEVRLFSGTHGGEVDFDDVQLTPEPVTLTLLGLGGLGLIRRRRRA